MAGGQNRKKLEGMVFGRWTVVRDTMKKGCSHWVCRCECGNEKTVRGDILISGSSTSCGCYIRDITSSRLTKHGMHDTPEYRAWHAMRQRCYNKKIKQYKDWGGRGITICEEWLQSFEMFYKDMGDRPSRKHSLHRINNELGYSKVNCIWATKKVQDRDRRSNRWFEYNGERLILKDWARKLKVSEPSITYHLLNNKPFNEIVEYFQSKVPM